MLWLPTRVPVSISDPEWKTTSENKGVSKGKLPKASWVRRRASLRGHRGPAADHCEGPCKITCCLYVWGTLGRHEVVICGTSSFICFSEKYTSRTLFKHQQSIMSIDLRTELQKPFPILKYTIYTLSWQGLGIQFLRSACILNSFTLVCWALSKTAGTFKNPSLKFWMEISLRADKRRVPKNFWKKRFWYVSIRFFSLKTAYVIDQILFWLGHNMLLKLYSFYLYLENQLRMWSKIETFNLSHFLIIYICVFIKIYVFVLLLSVALW